ncbi:MAG: hemolysin III family protein [Egibacteraceae bacterium]
MTTPGPPISPPPVERPRLRGWSHLVAFAVSIVAGPLLVAGADPRSRWLVGVYVAGATAVFGVSALYHRVAWSVRARAIMRRLDHATIFVLIAASYTAVGGLALPHLLDGVLLWLIWVGALVGIALQLVVPHWRRLAAASYLALGWVVIPGLPALHAALAGGQVALLLGGGLFYTAGAIIYATKRPGLAPRVFGYHELFHALVIAAVGCHLVLVLTLAGTGSA